jgi:MoaA/NifB/PqqE/SkfB family radical SAM enzyme
MLKKLVVELTNLCNLDCDYCFKEPGTTHLDITLLHRLLEEARTWGASKITYTGGEVAVYPQLEDVFQRTESLGYRYAVVTNGWHFDRLFPLLINARASLSHIFFSLDSASEAQHDNVRGKGSYKRVLNGVACCKENTLPFSFLVTVNQRNHNELETLARLAADLGGAGITFGHLLPTSKSLDQQLSLNHEERQAAETEAKRLRELLGISVSFSASASNDAAVCCEPLAGRTVSVDSRGRVSLCCQLTGYRHSAEEQDIIADLNTVSFGRAYAGFLSLALVQRMRRSRGLLLQKESAQYPCDFCVAGMKKTEWRGQSNLAVRLSGP